MINILVFTPPYLLTNMTAMRLHRRFYMYSSIKSLLKFMHVNVVCTLYIMYTVQYLNFFVVAMLGNKWFY